MPAIRNACPPTGFVTAARMIDGMLDCVVAFDECEDWPGGAMLLPVSSDARRWWPADSSGAAIRSPRLEDITAEPRTLDDASHRGPGRVAIRLPWPGPVHRDALVLLLHGGPGDARPAVLSALRQLSAAALDRGVACCRTEPAASDQPQAPFALASCQFPAGMIDGRTNDTWWLPAPTDAGLAGRSLFRLAQRVRGAKPEQPSHIDASRLALAVLCGDNVYVDATAGLFDARKLLDRFEFAHRRSADNLGLQRLLGNGCELVALLGDHEIDDKWEPLAPQRPQPPFQQRRDEFDENQQLMGRGRRYFLDRQRHAWAAPALPVPLFDLRAIAGNAFFFTDTRTERRGRNIENFSRAPIMRWQQALRLRRWIGAQTGTTRPAFIVSPSMVLPRPLFMQRGAAMALHADDWCGYPASLHALLAWVFDTRASNLVFLSGGEHLSFVATIELRCPEETDQVVRVYSVHSSALHAPFPFANAVGTDFAADETFTFSHPRCGMGQPPDYVCTVSTWFPQCGDGFALLQPESTRDGWRLRVEFDGERLCAEQVLRIG